ncbi:hypothetical protein R1flu_011436 [Riccia fluitans]|uniref:Glycosyltransferase 61 catalytic domain-containing protein n=1 Tax=Riccia fluitans TaxID=41844 RepID=A0ABD1ZAE5_9MARC
MQETVQVMTVKSGSAARKESERTATTADPEAQEVAKEGGRWRRICDRRKDVSGKQQQPRALRGGAVRGCFLRSVVPLLLFCLLLPYVFQCFDHSRVPPRAFSLEPSPEPVCTQQFPSVSLDNSSFCTGACKEDCFPRVRNICFSAKKVRLCNSEFKRYRIKKLGDHARPGEPPIPHFMRFQGERLTVGVQYSDCDEDWEWVDGLTAVADQRFLPYNKPNPHHEAEKIIPALLLAKTFGTPLRWFANHTEISKWARGFLEAFGMEERVHYLTLPAKRDAPVCFRDAILLSSPTNLRYVPDESTNEWLRNQVLEFCNLPRENSSSPISSAVILDRLGGPRRLGNKAEIAQVVSETLEVPVIHTISGMGTFCEQVAPVTKADLFVVPHGSQNVVFLFARPGAFVIEVFPYLFYSTAFRNYTHAARLHVYSLLGLAPPGDWKLWFFSIFGWDFCFDKVRWCKNHARTQHIYADLFELERALSMIKRTNGSFT